MLSVKFSPSNSKLFSGIILIDPPFVDRQVFGNNKGEASMLNKIILARRDSWSSKEEAFEWLGKKLPWKNWDERVLHLYVVRHRRNSNHTFGSLTYSPI